MTPGPWPIAVAMIAVAGFHAARLAGAARGRRPWDADLSHLAMAVTMVVMLAGVSMTTMWGSLLFLAAAAWFGATAVRGYVLAGRPVVGPRLATAVSCAAMVYMLAPSPHPRMAGMGGGSATAWTHLVAQPLAAAVVVVASGAVCVREAGVLVHRRRPATGSTAASTCQFAMSAVAGYLVALTL